MNPDPPAVIFLVVDQHGAWVSDAFGTEAQADQEAKASDTDKLQHEVFKYELAKGQLELF